MPQLLSPQSIKTFEIQAKKDFEIHAKKTFEIQILIICGQP